jgi:hypothetical protein
MNISLNEDVDATNTIQCHLLVFVVPPVSHARHIFTARIVLLVALGKDHVLVERSCQPAALIALYPGIIVKATLDVAAVLVSVKPDVCNC